MDKQTWVAGLKAHLAECRQKTPIVPRESLTDEEEHQCRIIGGEFLSWYQQHLEGVLKERVVLYRTLGVEKDPHIVYATNMPGLVALAEILDEPFDYLDYGLSEEIGAYTMLHPDQKFTYHLRHWSSFGLPSSEVIQEAKKMFPHVDPSRFRVHRSGELWGTQCGHYAEHLWNWDGQEMELLEETFVLNRF